MRVGIGFDAHRLTANRKLILGGVEVPFDRGLEGHSDADVLTHAVCDAVLGAVGADDLGAHFPDSDPSFKDARSLDLLQRAVAVCRRRGYVVNNMDATVVAEQPRLRPFIHPMEGNLAASLGVRPEQVNVKATTTEGLGFTGRDEGIAAFAVVTVAELKTEEG